MKEQEGYKIARGFGGPTTTLNRVGIKHSLKVCKSVKICAMSEEEGSQNISIP